MTPDTSYTYWDPSRGKYVTIPLSSVIKPPSDDAEFRRKSVMAVDAVVTEIAFVMTKALLLVFLIVAFCFIKVSWDAYSHPTDAEIRRQNDIALAKLHTH